MCLSLERVHMVEPHPRKHRTAYVRPDRDQQLPLFLRQGFTHTQSLMVLFVLVARLWRRDPIALAGACLYHLWLAQRCW